MFLAVSRASIQRTHLAGELGTVHHWVVACTCTACSFLAARQETTLTWKYSTRLCVPFDSDWTDRRRLRRREASRSRRFCMTVIMSIGSIGVWDMGHHLHTTGANSIHRKEHWNGRRVDRGTRLLYILAIASCFPAWPEKQQQQPATTVVYNE